MENESEMIRQQMDETRTSMTDKIEMLEHQVVDTVQAASTAVAETVASVKEIVHDSLQTVKDSMHETVESVKDTSDLKRQVERRPWTMFAGATALGYLGSYLLRDSNGRAAGTRGISESRALALKAHTAVSHNGAMEGRNGAASTARHEIDAPLFSTPEKPSWLSDLGDTFHTEISQLKGLAVGVLVGIVRDIVMEAAPEHMGPHMKEIADGIAVKLGGRPIKGHIFPERPKMEEIRKHRNEQECGHRLNE
jgi:ElaB/YqjD/DUF883 family membrane-anchored ribosome-binding protein